MIPVWLYVPQRPEVLQQLVQLNHTFVMLTKGSYDLIGYLADHYQISPIYCDTALKQGQPWLHQLYHIGWLILKEADTTQLVLHALFHMTKREPSQPVVLISVRSAPLIVDLIPKVFHCQRGRSVQFHPAPFPYGYPPPAYPTATPTAQSTSEAQASSSNIVETYPLDTHLSSDAFSTIDLQPMSNTDLDFGYQHWGLSTTTSISSISESTWPVSNKLIEASYEQPVLNNFHPDLQWRDKNASKWTNLNQSQRSTLNREMKQSLWPCIVLLTRWLFMGALWIGQDRDSLSVSPADIYSTMTMVLKEINPSNIDYHTPDIMHVIIMSALDEMYAQPHLYPDFRGAVMALPFLMERNVLPIEPKSQRPGFVSNRSRRRRMLDVVDIDTQSNTNDASMNVFGEVLNNGGFTYEKSLRSVWDVPESYFTEHLYYKHSLGNKSVTDSGSAVSAAQLNLVGVLLPCTLHRQFFSMFLITFSSPDGSFVPATRRPYQAHSHSPSSENLEAAPPQRLYVTRRYSAPQTHVSTEPRISDANKSSVFVSGYVSRSCASGALRVTLRLMARFIASQKLRTELYVLLFLLKDHVYPGNLWELVGERSIEAMQEEILRRHQSTCTSGDDKRHATVERMLMDERKKRCQMEVSLYSQAIELLEQHWMCMSSGLPHQTHGKRLYQHTAPLPCAPLACSITTRGMWEAWLTRDDTHLISVAESEIWFASQEERRAPISLNCISPSLPLSSTWVTTNVQEAFYNAFQEELNMQAELMTMSLATRHNNTYLHNLGLDLLILQSKTRCTEAEIELYNVAIENAHGFDLCGSSSKAPLNTTIQRPLCKAAHCYDEDKEVDDGSEGYEDYEDWKL
ncbi:hypothetical protein C8R48DRAFT_679964 [Suillus tomentosus]|nr:hypothetical protein C8R48DRAFT_679964 [Suillus tomentosus]